MKSFDVVLLTKKGFYHPTNPDWYIKQVIHEDELLQNSLEKLGLRVHRTYWDHPDFDFSTTKLCLFRAIWDYFHRFEEFSAWINKTTHKTRFINPPEVIRWNIDKHYLQDLAEQDINIPPTLFISKNNEQTLTELFYSSGWKDVVLKPVISGAGRHTYKLNSTNLAEYEEIYKQLISQEDMMLQEFQYKITDKGEVAFMIFNGKFSHAVLKKAKKGDFRVQDDFGGTVHHYKPSNEEIKFAEKVVSSCTTFPLYARVDIFTDNNNKPAVSELELIEPELWLRFHPPAADLFAKTIFENI